MMSFVSPQKIHIMKTISFTLLLVSLSYLTFATGAKKQAIIQMQSPSGYVDQTIVYFDLGVSPAFSAVQDAPKVFANMPDIGSIYSISSDGISCSINGYSALASSAVIPLGIKIDSAGNYLFSKAMLSNFDSSTIIQLEDRQENIFINLGNNFYAVQLTDTGITNGRFFLHISSAIEVTMINSGCQNNDGMLNISQDSSITWTSAGIYNLNDSLITGLNNVSGPYAFSNLSEGDYRLVLYFNSNYVTAKLLHLDGNYVAVQIQPLQLTASVAEQIIFHTTALNATTYFWNFGEGSQINGVANPTFDFMQPGVFTVVLSCSNAYGCKASDSVTITVSGTTEVNNIIAGSRNIWAYAKTITAVLTEEVKPGAELKVYNLLGQPVYASEVNQATSTVSLNNQEDGYYVVSLTNNNVTSVKNVILTK
jgi:hypothetical protein